MLNLLEKLFFEAISIILIQEKDAGILNKNTIINGK